ncbi:hypothetical protein A2U01_0060171, partial [Trifolium medium]|nr:hypothetical protein [Trifolium medium]
MMDRPTRTITLRTFKLSSAIEEYEDRLSASCFPLHSERVQWLGTKAYPEDQLTPRENCVACLRKPKTEATLEAIVQREGEPPRTYIERFNKAAVEVKTDDRMKLY